MFHHNFPELMLTSIYNDTKQRNQDMKEWQGQKTEKQKGRYRTNKFFFFLKDDTKRETMSLNTKTVTHKEKQ